MTLLINILPYGLDREVIPSIEDGITSKGYHRSAIPLLHLAHLFRQIDDFFFLGINVELLEASELGRQFTCEIIFVKYSHHNEESCD